MKKCENINSNCSLNHECRKLCYQDCSECTVRVDKTLPCGHINYNVPCGLKSEEIKCNISCNRILSCNKHKCLLKCYEKCKDCEVKVSTILY